MLDKTLEYSGFSKIQGLNRLISDQKPTKNFRHIKIIFEDDIGWYVESLEKWDASSNGIRYSIKKSRFILKVKPQPLMAFTKFWKKYSLSAGRVTTGDAVIIWKECCKWVQEQIEQKGVAGIEIAIRKELGES